MKKKALILSYWSRRILSVEFLLKIYCLWVKRRSSSINTGRIDHIYQDPHLNKRTFISHYGYYRFFSVTRLINQIKPDEIYNLAAQSHVQVSFESPEYTANADALGALRILEAIKFNGLEKNKILSSGIWVVWSKWKIPKMKKHFFIQLVLMVENMHTG